MLKRFLFIFLPISAFLAGIAVIFYSSDIETERAIIESNEAHNVKMRMKVVANDFVTIVSDLMYLSGESELVDYLSSGDTGIKKEIASEFLRFSRHKRLYDQIRFMDETGMEIVRVNYNSGNPEIVVEDKLQHKGDRYYFKDTYELERGEVFVSPFDLNVEQGKVQTPLKPVIRFGTPVYDSEGRKRGILIMNYFGAKLISNLRAVSDTFLGEMMLLNSDGYWLLGLNRDDEWGFMFENGKEKTFKNAFPKSWPRISETNTGQFHNDKGFFTYVTVYPLLEGQKSTTGSVKPHQPSAERVEAGEYYWKIVSRVPSDVFGVTASKNIGKLLLMYLLIIGLAGIGIWLLDRPVWRAKTLPTGHTSPMNLLLIIAISIFVAEAFIMLIIQVGIELPPLVEGLIDSTLLVVLTSPTIYFFLIRPLMLHIEERRSVEKQREALIADLDKTNVELKDFAYIVSHDLKAPLRAISTLASWISKDNADQLDDEGKENLELLMGRTKRMNNLIEGILRYSRLGQIKPDIELLNVQKTVDGIINGLAAKGDTGVEIKATLPQIVYQKTHLEQVFQNLIGNAIKHMGKPGGEVVVSCSELDTFWEFCVSDNGVGIDEKHFERIFKMFQSLKSRDERESTGIGLTIVKKIVEQYGGEVRVESKVGEGSSFFFTVPKELSFKGAKKQD